MIDYYATLGVTPEAPPEVIRAAYKVLAQKHHPDRHASDPAADEQTRRITEAFRVLSDPQARASYDATRKPHASVPHPPAIRAAAPVMGSAAGHEFTLRFIPGTVISNDLWSETQVSSRGGGGMTIAGFGYNSAPKVRSQSIAKQRIGVRSNNRDVFVDQAGSHIPVAAGQDVELVQASGGSGRAEGVVALVNRSTGQWFWIGSQMDAGSLIRKPIAQFRDFIAYIVLVALIGLAMWAFFVRGSGFLVWGAFIILGIPALLGAATPMLFRTANRIGAAMRTAISRAVEQPVRR